MNKTTTLVHYGMEHNYVDPFFSVAESVLSFLQRLNASFFGAFVGDADFKERKFLLTAEDDQPYLVPNTVLVSPFPGLHFAFGLDTRDFANEARKLNDLYAGSDHSPGMSRLKADYQGRYNEIKAALGINVVSNGVGNGEYLLVVPTFSPIGLGMQYVVKKVAILGEGVHTFELRDVSLNLTASDRTVVECSAQGHWGRRANIYSFGDDASLYDPDKTILPVFRREVLGHIR